VEAFFGGFSFSGPAALLAGRLLLRLRAKEVQDFGSPEVSAAAKELQEAIDSGKHPCGIAAPQFGRRLRIIAFGEPEDEIKKLTAAARWNQGRRASLAKVLVNPVLKRPTGVAFFFERSAAVPKYEGVVGRALQVEVEAFDVNGNPVKFVAENWQARQLQHAVDVLDGILYVDRMERQSFRREAVEDELATSVPYGSKVEIGKPITKEYARILRPPAGPPKLDLKKRETSASRLKARSSKR